MKIVMIIRRRLREVGAIDSGRCFDGGIDFGGCFDGDIFDGIDGG